MTKQGETKGPRRDQRQSPPAAAGQGNLKDKHTVKPAERQAARKAFLDTIPDEALARRVSKAIDAELVKELADKGQVAEGADWSALEAAVAPIEWDWSGWMARGIMAIMASESGMGKSGLALRVAGSYIKRWTWPDGTRYDGPLGSVLWCEAEAGQAIHLERARAWGLPLKKLLTPLADPLADIYLDDPEHQAAIEHMAARDDVRLIVVDSLSGANRQKENDSDMRAIGKWLAELARNLNKPLLVTHHLRKRGLLDGNNERVGLDRLRGSSAIAQFGRVIWALDAPDPSDEEHKRLSVIKSNLAKIPAPAGVRITGEGVQFDAAPEAPKTETLQDKAADLLYSLLADGPMDAVEVEKHVKGAGISMHAANRAKDKIGVASLRLNGKWQWSLPLKGDHLQ